MELVFCGSKCPLHSGGLKSAVGSAAQLPARLPFVGRMSAGTCRRQFSWPARVSLCSDTNWQSMWRPVRRYVKTILKFDCVRTILSSSDSASPLGSGTASVSSRPSTRSSSLLCARSHAGAMRTSMSGKRSPPKRTAIALRTVAAPLSSFRPASRKCYRNSA